MASSYIAHTREGTGETQELLEHLANTARLAAEFAAAFGGAEAAFRCGLLHDIGKYSAAGQKRMRGAAIRVDHSTAGAIEAWNKKDAAAAFCIAGHHAGLPDRGGRASVPPTLLGRVLPTSGYKMEDYSAWKTEVQLPEAEIPAFVQENTWAAFFYTHMLYSCLVDADWLDTEAFQSGGAVQRGTGEDLQTLWDKLNRYISGWWNPKELLNQRRTRILGQLIAAGERDRGLYTLTVPTGGGKTVSAMAFALRHALHTGQRRIIYVIPYTSILEQTQAVFETIFGPQNVVAHYANVTYDTDEYGELSHRDRQRYLASENWDAPVILTTSVQFFESLYGNRSSKCRKLHSIANSVIIFDEAQMLPVPSLRPCVAAITQLVKHYRCTAVLCTATQPALGPLIGAYLTQPILELCPDTAQNEAFFRRVRYQYEGQQTDEALAQRLAGENQVLCIVNSRKQAQKLYQLLPKPGSFHLSTSMYAAHRRRILEKIRKCLKDGEPCRVVSTSLIEAGVDVDFPTVYRAVAGLDSILQAGGRCNREGRNAPADSLVHVFDTEAEVPPSLQQNIAAARQVMARWEDIASGEAVAAYFKTLLYVLKGEAAMDEKGIFKLIEEDFACAEVAKRFHLIQDNTITVYIPLEEGRSLMEQLRRTGPTRALLRKLGQYSVGVYQRDYRRLDSIGAVEQLTEDTAVLLNTSCYTEGSGLTLKAEGGEALFG